MSMSMAVSRIVTLAVAILVLGATATASAAAKKPRAERTTTSATMCGGTPIIMQGMECPRRPARGEQQDQEQKQPTERAERPRAAPRGSSGAYVPSPQRTPSLTLTQPPSGPYIPPPVANPSAQIQELNHSFPLNRGLGNNPTDRDSYIRYNLNR